MAKLIAFFADMDLESGIGHVMRCKAIADSIKDLELESILILNSIDNILINKFEINKSFKKIYNVNFVKNLDHINTILVVDTYKLSINDAIFNHN
jgi:spore coat polysaccharide biosynthesis predicted glycosyltransferase SpsG